MKNLFHFVLRRKDNVHQHIHESIMLSAEESAVKDVHITARNIFKEQRSLEYNVDEYNLVLVGYSIVTPVN